MKPARDSPRLIGVLTKRLVARNGGRHAPSNWLSEDGGHLAKALAHNVDAEARIALTRPDGLAPRPKGSAVTSDGRCAVVSGGVVDDAKDRDAH
jgi:hypothetical protein